MKLPHKFVVILVLLAVAGVMIGLWVIMAAMGSNSQTPEVTLQPLVNEFRLSDVPYHAQPTDEDCLGACLQMLLEFHGVEIDTSDLYERLATGGVSGSHMFRAYQLLNANNTPFVMFYPDSIETVKRLVSQGYPVIVPVSESNASDRVVHGVVVIGYSNTEELFWIHDPYYGENRQVNADDFDRQSLYGGGYTRLALSLCNVSETSLPPALFPFADVAEDFEQARLHLDNGKVDSAVPLLETVTGKSLNFLAAQLYLGSSYSSQEQWNKAEVVFARVVQQDPMYYWGVGRLKLAAVQVTNKRYRQAEDNFRAFLAENPQAPDEYRNSAKDILEKLERLRRNQNSGEGG